MVITSIKTDGTVARTIRQVLSEHFDLEVRSHHTPGGKNILVELELYPKGSVPVEKPPKRKNKRM